MTRVIPHPILSALLVGLWLLLNQSVSPGHILLGSVLGVTGGVALSALQIPTVRMHRPGVAVRLAFIVLADIIRSNFVVAGIIFTSGHHSTVGIPGDPARTAQPLRSGGPRLHHHVDAGDGLGQVRQYRGHAPDPRSRPR